MKLTITILLIALFLLGHSESVRQKPIYTFEKEYSLKSPSKEDVLREVKRNCKKFPVDVAMGIISAESNFNHLATNKHSSSIGLMQIVKPTSKWVHEKILKIPIEYNHNRLFCYQYNIQIGCAYLEYLYEKTIIILEKQYMIIEVKEAKSITEKLLIIELRSDYFEFRKESAKSFRQYIEVEK